MSKEADEQAGPKYDRCASATGLLISIPAGAWRSLFWGTSMSEKPFHEAANVFPLLQGEQLKALADDIAENGLQEAIWLHEDGSILDGRNRFRACKIAGVEPRFQTYEGSDPLGFVLSLNLHRRHLTSAQKAALAVDVEAYERVAAKQRQGTRSDIGQKIDTSESGRATEKAAAKVGTNRQYVSDAKRIKKDAPDVFERMREGGYPSMAQAKKVARLPENDRREIHALVDEGKAGDTKEANQLLRERQTQQRAQELGETAAKVPKGKYQCIVIDPPWPMKKIKRDERQNQAGFDYPTLNEGELRDFPVPDMAADDCHLYLWTTHKFMPMALRLAEHWGFRYQCMMTWVKNVGFTPFSWMYSTEHVLFCRRGSLKLKKMGLRLDFSAKVREHSRKPDVFYELVEQASPGPRIDVFSREERAGFDQFGNETEAFNA